MSILFYAVKASGKVIKNLCGCKGIIKKRHMQAYAILFAIFLYLFAACGLGDRRMSPSLSALCVRTISPSRPSYSRHIA